VTARTPYNIRKIATRVIVEGADVKHVQHILGYLAPYDGVEDVTRAKI